MNDDFTEEEEFNELPEGVEFAEPVPKPVSQSRPRAPAPAPMRQKVRRQPVQAAPKAAPQEVYEDGVGAEQAAPAERYAPYIMEKKVGIFDNESKQPLMEDTDTNTLILGLVTKLLNDIDDIKRNL